LICWTMTIPGVTVPAWPPLVVLTMPRPVPLDNARYDCDERTMLTSFLGRPGPRPYIKIVQTDATLLTGQKKFTVCVLFNGSQQAVPWGLQAQKAVLSKHNAFPDHFMITTTSQTVCVINFSINLNAGFYSLSGSWDNMVSKVTRLWPGQCGFQILEEARYYLLFKISRLTLGTNQPPIQ
jgi:hypothetical protein